MTDFNYNDIIEYIDATYDENFEDAKHWAREHNTTFEELMDRRDLPKRYFQIGPEPKPYVPTPEELIRQEIWQLKAFLAQTDYVVIKIAEGEEPDEHALEVIAERKKARARINELEAELEPKEESGE